MNRVVFFPIAFLLLLLTLILFPPVQTTGNLGLCLPSPNEWHLPRFVGWLINSVLIFLSVSVMSSANKKYNFIPEAEPVMSMALALLLACNCFTTSTLTTSTLLLAFNVACLFIIISTYEENNATREYFIVGTLPAIGAMFQYSFLVMIPVYIGGGLLMKSFRLKEFIAFLFGLAAPYWITIGMGIIAPDAFHYPGSLTVINPGQVETGVNLTLITSGIMGGIGLILALYNGVKLFTRNSRLRCMHITFNLMGCVSLLGLLFDFDNFTAYFGTLALWFAIETATFFHLYNLRYIRALLIGLLIIFLPLYIIEL